MKKLVSRSGVFRKNFEDDLKYFLEFRN